MANALHLSPFSPEVAALSPSEFYWTLLNHNKDLQEEFDKIKLLCQFINPAEAAQVFENKEQEKTESTPDVFFDNVAADLKGKYTPEELEAMMSDPKHYSELDRIEKA